MASNTGWRQIQPDSESEAATETVLRLPILYVRFGARQPTLTQSSDHSMSQVTLTPSTSSSSNFQSIFNAALERYENKTKNKLFAHPLASQFQSCDSPAAVLSLLQELVQQFDQGRGSYERLSNWLNPTVNVLFALSATLGEGVGLVSLN